jgi:hypothetical protein
VRAHHRTIPYALTHCSASDARDTPRRSGVIVEQRARRRPDHAQRSHSVTPQDLRHGVPITLSKFFQV